MRTGSKRKALRVHAKRRASERYGLVLNNDQLDELARMIHAGQSRRIEKQSHRVEVHRLTWQGRAMVVVYDCQRKQIVTFLDA